MAEVTPGAVAPAAPVETPVTSVTPAPDSPADQATDAPQGSEQPSKPESRTYTEQEYQKALQKRLGIESRRLERIARAEARAELAERQLQERLQPQQQRQPASDGKPQWSQFAGKEGDVELFLEALADWKFEQRTKSERKQTDDHEQERVARDRYEFVQSNLIKPGTKKYGPEYESIVMNEDLPISSAMAGAIAKLPNGVDVWYHIATHEDEVHRIAGLSDLEQVWEMKELSKTLAAPPKTTNAPPPIVPGSGNGTVQKDYGRMTTKEHVEAYAAEQRKKRLR